MSEKIPMVSCLPSHLQHRARRTLQEILGELNKFLVERSGVWLQDGEQSTSLERASDAWIINKTSASTIHRWARSFGHTRT